MENLRKKNKTEMQNKTEGQSSRLEQAEDRISELEDEMVIKGKTKELLVQQLKTCGKKMQELTPSKEKGMRNIFNEIITENFPNLEKTMPIQV
jgi:predicted nuclease with TOPRIM domain